MRTFTRWCSNMTHWRTSIKTVFTLLLLTLFIFRSDAQNINVTFQQGSNENNTLGEIKWINSILQDNNSRIAEGMSTLQRVIITKLTPSTAQQTLIFKLQADKGGFHAYDFITSWEQALDATADIAPGKGLYPPTTSDPDMHNCADLATGGQPPSETQTCNSLRDGIYKTQVYIPTAGSAGSETNNPLLGDVESTVDVIAAYETTYGPRWLDFYADAAISGTSLRFLKYEAGYVFYEFKWTTNNASNLMIEFAAHVSLGISTAGQLGYGAGRGASQISGGPYHVILESTTLGGMGAMDNQLQGSDIVLQPTCNLTGDQLVCVSDGNQIYNGNPASLDNPVYSWAFTDDNIATANDNTSGASFVGATDGPTVTVNPGTGGLFRLRFIVTNDGDLADTCYLVVTVNSAPTITCPTNQTENACQSQSAINTRFATWLASVVSSGGTPTTNPVTPVAPSACGGSVTVTWTVTNDCGTQTCSASFTVTADNTPPAFTGSYADVNLTCNPASSAITGALGSATATDNCGTPSISHVDGTVQSSSCNRWQIRTFTATDACGNTATVSRRVNWIADVAPPVFTGSYADVNLNCNPVESAITAALDGATATDGCGTPTVTQSDGTTQSSGCNRWRIRTFTATDGCGNTATVSRRVNWVADVAPPVFTGSYADVNLNCNPAESAITGALNGATATDACGTPTVTQSDGTTQSSGCNRWRIRTFTATDGCGNTATVARRVNWIADVAPPVFTGSYADVNLNCNPAESAITAALDGATATDGCGTPTVSQSDGTTQSSGCNRWRIRTFTATDGCGNTATVARRVNWIADVAPPVFTGSYADVNLNCNPAASAITAALGSATATDNCGTPSISQSTGTVQSSSCNRWQIRTFTATDGCGNTATVSRRVNWIVDVAPPALVGVPSNVDLDCGAEIPAPANVTATDNCGSVTPNYSFTDVAADCTSGFSRVVTRRWTVEDGCGNTASAQQVIRVRCCIDLLCTYTQGYFGNPGGLSCDGVNDDITTADLINGALGGGGLVVGRVPKTVTIPSGYGAYLINVLPGGGQPTLLSLDNVVLSNSSPYLPLSYLKNGKINNVLLSQTITLSLNARLNGGVLANFPIESGYLVTQKSSGCGEDATAVPCDFEDNMDAIQSFWMNQAVVDYLTAHSTPNVQGLLNLANDLLGGVLVPGGINSVPSYSNVVSALDAINRGFDECRFTLGYSADPVGCPEPPLITTSRPDPGVSNLTEVSKLTVAAYPNPYTDKVNFVIASPVSGQAQLEVYNMVGQRVASVYNGYIQAHVPHMVGYNVSTEAQQNLIYILRIGGQQVTGKLLNAKR